MLPQLSGIQLQSTRNTADSDNNLSRSLPVGKDVNATVIAVSKDQLQSGIFRLKLEVNSRLIQLGTLQALPIGQKVSINRQADGQIQITLQMQTASSSAEKPEVIVKPQQQTITPEQQQTQVKQDKINNLLKLQFNSSQANNQLLSNGEKLIAAVISSRPIMTMPQTQNNIASGMQAGTTEPAIANNKSLTPNTAQPTTKASISHNPITSATTLTTGIQSTTASQQSPPQANSQPLANTAAINSTATTASAQLASNTSQATATTQAAIPSIQTATPAIQPKETGQHLITLALPNGSKIEAIAPRALIQGTQIQLQQTTDKSVQVLQIKEPSVPPTSALDKPEISAVLRQSLPNQIATGDAFNQLAQVSTQVQNTAAAEIGNVVRSMLQLFGVRPGSPDAPIQIKQNVELGGITTERNLSQSSKPDIKDMKGQLHQLQKLTDKLPVEQRKHFEQLLKGVHSRVTSQQLHSLQQWRELPDGGFERVFQLDLPIKQGEKWENLELRLSREGGKNAAGELVSVWRVKLHFDLEEQGGVDAEVRLTDEYEISTLFWCEQKETADKLKSQADSFAERLRQCGFNNAEVDWHQGSAPEQKQSIQKQLIDLHT